MGQILHGRATTTYATRAAIQRSTASASQLARQYGINVKTVLKWRHRAQVEDRPMGPKQPRSTSLSREEEAACLIFRRHTQLPLDDCLYALQDSIPHLSRSSLHRLFQRHGISRLPEPDAGTRPKKSFKAYPIGYVHIDIAEVRTEQGRHHLFVAIDRTSKFVVARLESQANRRTAAAFLDHVIEVLPYRIHTVLTDNGIQFTDSARYRDPNKPLNRRSRFDQRCVAHGIEHRLTRPNHPWTNGQVERMNQTLKAATIKRYHYADLEQLQSHLQTFLAAYNYAKKLKTLKGKTPAEFISAEWARDPQPFFYPPNQLLAGPNT
ncbi:IS481 family transposase [Salinisphaera hydrothermalis]|uniref:IS481 family transposase n=1 Tax=Salinisphaera hydrothermalis TaxID=563188 RepID=UPI003340EC14